MRADITVIWPKLSKNINDLVYFQNLFYLYAKRAKNRKILKTRAKDIKNCDLIEILILKLDALNNKKLEIERRLERSYEENKCVVEEEITRMITERLLEAKKSEETSKFGKMKTFIEQKHSDNLKVFEEKEEIKKMKQSEEEERLLVEEEKQRRIMEIRAATVKKTAEEFRKKKEEERLTQKQKEEDELALVENIKKEAIREQLPIIRGRQAEAETKFIHNYQVKYVKKLEALIRKDELDRIAENLPERPVAERDVARLVQETETVKRKFAKEEKVEEWYKDYGYKVDDLMKDMRFKVATALGVLT